MAKTRTIQVEVTCKSGDRSRPKTCLYNEKSNFEYERFGLSSAVEGRFSRKQCATVHLPRALGHTIPSFFLIILDKEVKMCTLCCKEFKWNLIKLGITIAFAVIDLYVPWIYASNWFIFPFDFVGVKQGREFGKFSRGHSTRFWPAIFIRICSLIVLLFTEYDFYTLLMVFFFFRFWAGFPHRPAHRPSLLLWIKFQKKKKRGLRMLIRS